MSKLVLNDDGTITLPLRGGKEPLVLPEPSIAQLAEMVSYVSAGDDMIPDMPAVDTDDPASLAAAQAVLRERTLKIYDVESPYGTAIVKIVKLAAEVDITLDDLPSWAAAPQTCRQILSHWQAPLGGED